MHLQPSDPRARAIRAIAAQHSDPAYWEEQPDASTDFAPTRASSTQDLGDAVADIIEARMGKVPASGHAPAASSPPKAAPTRAKSTGDSGKDFGDQVADAYDALRGKQVSK